MLMAGCSQARYRFGGSVNWTDFARCDRQQDTRVPIVPVAPRPRPRSRSERIARDGRVRSSVGCPGGQHAASLSSSQLSRGIEYLLRMRRRECTHTAAIDHH